MKRMTIAVLLGALALGGCSSKTKGPTVSESSEQVRTEQSLSDNADAVSSSSEGNSEENSEAESDSSAVADSKSIFEAEINSGSEAVPGSPDASDQGTASGSKNTKPGNQQSPEEPVDTTPQPVYLDDSWEFAEKSAVHTGNAVLYKAAANRKNLVIGVNAGHGCSEGASVYTDCHPDGTPKITGGSTAAGATQATACAVGMTFPDGTPERDVTLAEAQLLKSLLLEHGYDVLMIREEEDVQLDNIARTVLCNNAADCHIALHWDGDGLDYDKGCYYMSVPEGLKAMYPVSKTWEKSNHLGDCLISGLMLQNCQIFESGSMEMDLTQTSYSTVPSIDIELGNAASDHSHEMLEILAQGLLSGIQLYFEQ